MKDHLKRMWVLLIAVTVLAAVSGCGSDDDKVYPLLPPPQTKQADFTAAELVGNTIYVANTATTSGTFDAYTFNADGTLKAVTNISATSPGTTLAGTWSISAGILRLSIAGRPPETETKASATLDSNQAFTVASSSGATTKWFYNQINGGTQALALASGAPVPAPATLTAVNLSPNPLSTAVGWSQQFTATAVYSENSTRDVTSAAAWSSSNTNAATVTSAGMLTAAGAGSSTISATYGGVTGTAPVTVTYTVPVLNTIVITPESRQVLLPIGQTQQFKATGQYTGGSTKDVTTTVTWVSSDSSVAPITAGGLLTAVGIGVAEVHAEVGGSSGMRSGTTIVYSGETPVTLAGKPTVAGFADGTGQAALFANPTGITSDGTYLYVADTGNNCIRRVAISTGAVTTLAGSPTTFGSADGSGTGARFYGPTGVTTDGSNLYVADTENHTIRKIQLSTGVVTTMAGSPGSTGSADGPGALAQFNRPSGITTDGTYVYVADANKAIRRISIATNTVTTFVSLPTFTLTGLPFEGLRGIATDGSNLYGIMLNSGNMYSNYYSTIYKVTLATGEVTFLPPEQGVFNPTAIAVDGTNLYITTQSHSGPLETYRMSLLTAAKTYLIRNAFNNMINSNLTGIVVTGNTLYTADGAWDSITAVRFQ